ncbi:MAG: dephospho-CoA kinase, partial [Prevotella sp.]|nr:dephospho-CoA kinase [Prevotella sp.]
RVYDCDAAAKQLMRTSSALQRDLCRLVCDDVYVDGVLQKHVLAKFLLASEDNKQAVNQIIHPAVARDFECSGYEWLESAILFDSGFDRRIHFDYIVCVSAPLEIRIQRVMNRDGISREKTMEWISRQLPQEEVLKRADFEIVNDGMEDIDEQILIVLNKMGGTKLPDSTTL